jgi:hypothetical protein
MDGTFWAARGCFLWSCPEGKARTHGCNNCRRAGVLMFLRRSKALCIGQRQYVLGPFCLPLAAIVKTNPRLMHAKTPMMQGAINFAIFSSSASAVSLVLFTEEDLQAGRTTHEIKLSTELNCTGSVWHIMLPKLDTSLLYGACQISNGLSRGCNTGKPDLLGEVEVRMIMAVS